MLNVSVIVPVFNRRDYLRQTLQSLLADPLPGVEILVIDDGSCDGSLETVNDLPFVRIHCPTKNGAAAARNLGLSKARGRYISFLDSDDLLCAQGLSCRFEILEKNPQESAVCGTIGAFMDERGRNLDSRNIDAFRIFPPRLTFEFFQRTRAIPPAILSLLLIRREKLAQVGLFREDLFIAEDRDFFFRMLRLFDIFFFPEPVVQYRIHSRGLSSPSDAREIRRIRAITLITDAPHLKNAF